MNTAHKSPGEVILTTKITIDVRCEKVNTRSTEFTDGKRCSFFNIGIFQVLWGSRRFIASFRCATAAGAEA